MRTTCIYTVPFVIVIRCPVCATCTCIHSRMHKCINACIQIAFFSPATRQELRFCQKYFITMYCSSTNSFFPLTALNSSVGNPVLSSTTNSNTLFFLWRQTTPFTKNTSGACPIFTAKQIQKNSVSGRIAVNCLPKPLMYINNEAGRWLFGIMSKRR